MLLCQTSSSNQYSGSESSAFLWKISGFQVFYSEQPSLCPAFKNSPNGIRLIFTLLYAWKCLYLFQMESQAECWTPVLSLCSGLWWALQTWLGLGHIGDSGYVLTRWQGKKLTHFTSCAAVFVRVCHRFTLLSQNYLQVWRLLAGVDQRAWCVYLKFY